MNTQDNYLTIIEGAAHFRAGQPVIFPTDTVWGVGAKWNSQRGVEQLYEVKQRDADKPMAILVAEVEQLEELALDYDQLTPEMHQVMVRLIHEFWPGGLTIVLPWSKKPLFYQWSDADLGVRVPNHPVAQELLRQIGPLLQSSANVAGGVAPTSINAIDPEFAAMTGGIVMGECGGESASTVVDLTGEYMRIVRAGCIPVVEVERVARG